MKKFKQDTIKFEGNYRGKVLDNDDPDELGRIKVRVLGVFDEIETVSLPWAIPAMPLFSGSGIDFGYFTVPEVDSFVWCFFEAGDIYQPVYFAEALSGIHGLPTERTTNYPFRKVMRTKNGIVIYVDDYAKEIKIEHPEGAYIKVDSLGNVIIQGTAVQINP